MNILSVETPLFVINKILKIILAYIQILLYLKPQAFLVAFVRVIFGTNKPKGYLRGANNSQLREVANVAILQCDGA